LIVLLYQIFFVFNLKSEKISLQPEKKDFKLYISDDLYVNDKLYISLLIKKENLNKDETIKKFILNNENKLKLKLKRTAHKEINFSLNTNIEYFKIMLEK